MRGIHLWAVASLMTLTSTLLVQCAMVSDSSSSKVLVVATTGMVADLAANIGGDSVSVKALMGPGVDPHLYKATQRDLFDLQTADVVFFNGLHLEGKMAEVLEKLGQVKTVVPITRWLDRDKLLQDPNYDDVPDPHVWFDVALWAETIDIVVQTLSEVDPASAEYYMGNGERYRTELLALDTFVTDQIARIPAEKRILITAHDAFNYFGSAYDIDVRGLQGISTLSEFGLRDRVDMVNFIAEKGINAVFVETSVAEKNIQAIVEGVRQKGHEVRIGGNLYSDAMGAAGTPEGTYVGMVRANVNTIVEGLTGRKEEL